MCNICIKVQNGYEPNEFNKLLSQIETKIKFGINGEHFKEALDKLLSTELNDRNEDIEADWENSYRETD